MMLPYNNLLANELKSEEMFKLSVVAHVCTWEVLIQYLGNLHEKTAMDFQANLVFIASSRPA